MLKAASLDWTVRLEPLFLEDGRCVERQAVVRDGDNEVIETVSTYPGRPAETPHAVDQLSSGSTGPSKVIARTAEDLVTEIWRYTQIDGVPEPGERIIVLASMVHVLGLVGALLYGSEVDTVIPARGSGVKVQATQAGRNVGGRRTRW